MAQPFDINRLKFNGDAITIANNVEEESFYGAGLFSVSENNALVYGASIGGWNFQPVWFDRSGVLFNS